MKGPLKKTHCLSPSYGFAVLAIVSVIEWPFIYADRNKNMERKVTLQIVVNLPDECECVSRYDILNLLNDKLRNDPGFFGPLQLENIIKVHRLDQSGGKTVTELLDGHTLE
jgi:hypothetical protein